VIETPHILERIINSSSWRELDDEEDYTNWFSTRWLEVFPEIPEDLTQVIVNKILYFLEIITDALKTSSIHYKLIGNPSTPVNIRENLKNQLIDYGVSNIDIIFALAYNPQIPYKERIDYLQQIISSKSNYYAQIARDARTPENILERLWQEEDSRQLKECMATNPATPEFILRRIADERNELLWWILAENPSTPIDLLYRFLNEKVESQISSSETIFDIVVSNTGLSALQRYRFQVEKENAQIATKAHELFAQRTNNFDSLAEVVETGYIRKKFAIARNSKTPVEILKRLTKDENVHVCACVLENPSFPLSCLMELAQNSNSTVQTYIARRTLPIPRDVIVWLLENGDTGIRSHTVS
jgi:ribosomal protein L18